MIKTILIIIGIVTVVFWLAVAVDLVMRRFGKSIPGVAQAKKILVKILSYSSAQTTIPSPL